jgi:hypothetical protein
MFIHEAPDGSLSYTGSFNRAQWDEAVKEHEAKREAEAAPKKAASAPAKKAAPKKDGE